MPGATNTLDLGGLVQQLQATADSVAKLDLSGPLKIAEQLLISDSKQAFAKAADVDGNPWPPLKAPRRLPGGLKQLDAKPLRDTGRLMASITGRIEEGKRVVVGTNVSYSVFHQYGTKYIVARRFLGISAKTRGRIEGLVRTAILKQLGGR